MIRIMAAVLAAASCASIAQAQTTMTMAEASGPVFTLDQAVAAAGGSAPMLDAAQAGVRAAEAGRTVAGLRPNPTVQTQVENLAGTGAYRSFDSAETTIGLSIPLELGGKRQARIGVADAQTSRARLIEAIAQADVRLQVTELYVAAVAAERRLVTARDQARIATEAANAARIRVQAGRASPIEEQRADVARINAEAGLETATRFAEAARTNLARRVGAPIAGSLDATALDQLPPPIIGPAPPIVLTGTLALAAANADLAVADAQMKLARSQRVPDLSFGPAMRRLEATNDTAAVFSLSLPIPFFNSGKAAVDQAAAERQRAAAQQRMTALDIEQAVTTARVEAANAATSARTANGPALAAAQEAARIARIGYREGKFSQLDLLDAERTLADTRLGAIDALAIYQNAKARLERLTARAPDQGN